MSKFNTLIHGDIPVLVDFYAQWCGPCKTMAPILKQLAGLVGEKAKIIKVDIDKNPTVAHKYHIRSVPTLILFKAGEERWRKSGVVPVQELKHSIDQFSA